MSSISFSGQVTYENLCMSGQSLKQDDFNQEFSHTIWRPVEMGV